MGPQLVSIQWGDVMNFEAMQHWFLGTIYGVLILGATGSILGTVLIFLIKKLARNIFLKRNDILIRIMLPLGLMIERGRAIRDAEGVASKDGKYLVFVMVMCCYTIFGVVAAFCFFSITVYIFIHYYLDRPVLLSFFLALSLIFLYGLLKDFLYLRSLACNDLFDEHQRIKKEMPKNYAEWVEVRKQRQLAQSDQSKGD